MKRSTVHLFSAPRIAASLGIVAALFSAGAPLSVSAETTSAACPSGQVQKGVYVALRNPNQGDSFTPGGYEISGNAFDTTPSEMQHVSLFLDDRDQGGMVLMDIVPGKPGAYTFDNEFGPGSFTTTIQLPDQPGEHLLTAYAMSKSGRESVTAVPITIQGADGDAWMEAPVPTSLPIGCGFASSGSTIAVAGAVAAGPAAAPSSALRIVVVGEDSCVQPLNAADNFTAVFALRQSC